MKLIFSIIFLILTTAAVHGERSYYDSVEPYPDYDGGYSDYNDEEEYSCSKHEEYSNCGTACERTCDTLHDKIICTLQCVRGCFCQKGYVRIKKGGKCIPESKCPKPTCKKPHEVWSECGKTVCEATCADPKKPYHCKAPCFPGCGCKEGYLRDSNGNCVLPKQCEAKCGPHEVWSDCGGIPCPPTCEVPFIACRAACRPGCGCKEGYLRDTQTGKCIPKDKCPPKCKGKNEVYSKCAPCDESCVKSGRICHAACLNPGCYCKPGYLRNKHGVCIPEDQCPKPECTKPHQVFSTCGANGCQATCREPDLPTRCDAMCIPGCICKPGYLLDDNKNCVPEGDCKLCKKKHEVYNDCGPHESCVSTCDKPVIPPGQPCPDVCIPGCFCKEGYVRDNKGNCVLRDDCPPKECPKNEYMKECGGFCYEKRCSDLIHPVMCRPGPCTPKCTCKKGFYRNKKGHCVAAKDCPEAQKCPKHEVFSECDKNCDKRCSHILEPILDCFMMGCHSGCVCDTGYYRNDQDVCILRDSCPKAPVGTEY